MTNRVFPGGYYKMNHESFGAMMVSEQLRPALVAVSKAIAARARLNTIASSGAPSGQKISRSSKKLADSYDLDRGPIIPLVVRGQGVVPRISHRVINQQRHAAAREFGRGGHKKGRGTRDLRRAGELFGDLAGEAG